MPTLSISSIPSSFNPKVILDGMISNEFILIHDFLNMKTLLKCDSIDSFNNISSLAPGLEFKHEDLIKNKNKRYVITPTPIGVDSYTISKAYEIFSNKDVVIYLHFIPVKPSEVLQLMKNIEKHLSGEATRFTKSFSNTFFAERGGSTQADLYYNSDERKLLIGMLDILNNIALRNFSAYSLIIEVDSTDLKLVENIAQYFRSQFNIKYGGFRNNDNEVRKDYINTVPFDGEHILPFLAISPKTTQVETLKCLPIPASSGDILAGEVLHDGIVLSLDKLLLEKRIFNLGTVITGLPGAGKSRMMMAIIRHLIEQDKDIRVIVIAPTKEWGNFAQDNSFEYLDFSNPQNKINLFSCNSDNRIKFAQDMAVLLANASGAGPYTRSLEKCLLGALTKTYSYSSDPNPTSMYSYILDEIKTQHAQKTAISTKYTKHGENILSSLEGLRLILSNPSYCFNNVRKISDYLNSNIVFDVSEISNNMKEFFYASILNQIYSIIEGLDEFGNEKLRILLVLEEAQIALGKEEGNAVVEDMKERIQDFRKKGVGLVLITHNVIELPASIRRLCQTKFYFRQAADISKHAVTDLGFKSESIIDATRKMLTLGQGVCAVTYANDENGSINIRGPIFLKTEKFDLPNNAITRKNVVTHEYNTMFLKVTNSSNEPIKNKKIEVRYLDKPIFSGCTDEQGEVKIEFVIIGKEYEVIVFGDKPRDKKNKKVIAKRDTCLISI